VPVGRGAGDLVSARSISMLLLIMMMLLLLLLLLLLCALLGGGRRGAAECRVRTSSPRIYYTNTSSRTSLSTARFSSKEHLGRSRRRRVCS
jgi:hypothetical protein